MVVIAASLPSCCHLEASFCVAGIVVSCWSVGSEGSGKGKVVGVIGLWEMCYLWGCCLLWCCVLSCSLSCAVCCVSVFFLWVLDKTQKEREGTCDVY